MRKLLRETRSHAERGEARGNAIALIEEMRCLNASIASCDDADDAERIAGRMWELRGAVDAECYVAGIDPDELLAEYY